MLNFLTIICFVLAAVARFAYVASLCRVSARPEKVSAGGTRPLPSGGLCSTSSRLRRPQRKPDVERPDIESARAHSSLAERDDVRHVFRRIGVVRMLSAWCLVFGAACGEIPTNTAINAPTTPTRNDDTCIIIEGCTFTQSLNGTGAEGTAEPVDTGNENVSAWSQHVFIVYTSPYDGSTMTGWATYQYSGLLYGTYSL